jgi:mono/diheme cytochrome c family protein
MTLPAVPPQNAAAHSTRRERRWNRLIVAAATLWALSVSQSTTSRVAHAATIARQDTAGQAATRSLKDGVYGAEQATRGEGTYHQECGSCHGQTLTGGDTGPALVGDDFIKEWTGMTVADLFERVSISMPQDSPGRLSRREYADVVAYLFKANNFPAGQNDLGTDVAVLKQILIGPRPAEK